MGTPPEDVNRLLDEIAAGDKPPASQPPAKPPADAGALLDQATKPPAAGSTPPKPPVAVDPEKFGHLVNENAELRRGFDRMKAEVEALRAQQSRFVPMPPSETKTPTNDGGWTDWGKKGAEIVNETDDATWLANPKVAVQSTLERVLTRTGRELAEHIRIVAANQAYEIGTAITFDNEFGERYPDLMATEMGQEAVKRAIGKVVYDQRFQGLMRNRASRPRAFAVVATIANQELGRTPEVDQALTAAEVPERKAPFAERTGARPMAGSVATPERNQEAMESVIAFQKAHS